MKIVFLQDDFPPQSFGGAGFSTYELALGMKRAGHEVSVITTVRKEDEAGESEYTGLRVFKIASDYNPRWRMYRNINNVPVVRKVGALLKELQPDVVHINNVHYHLSYRCFKVAKKYAKAVIFTARDTMSVFYGKLGTDRYLEHFDSRTTWQDHIKQVGKRYNPLHNFFTRRYLALADKRYAVSNALKDALTQNGIEDVGVIHTGMRVEEWGATEEEKSDFRKLYNLEGKRIVLFGGRLSEGKGGTKAFETLGEVCKEVPDAVLLIAGKMDVTDEEMKRDSSALGIESRVVVTGWIPREVVRVAYATADVVLVPSLYLDPFPRIVIEAMASGKPVVGTCYGGAPEIITDGVTGYVVNPQYPKEVALKIIELLRNRERAERFGKAGYERIERDFNLEDVVKKYIVVYESLVRGGARE